MVAALVILTFVILVALDYYVFSRRYPEAKRAPVRAPPLLATISHALPLDTYVHPTFTWSRWGPAGTIYLGLHPMLLGLIGPRPEIEFRAVGERIAKGEILAWIGRGAKRLTVHSPLTARIEMVNDTQPRTADDKGGVDGIWMYRLAPERLGSDTVGWLAGEEAIEWGRRRYGMIRDYLIRAASDRHLGMVMADGGDLPVGVLCDMDARVWSGVQDLIAPPPREGRP